jgi:hypothetical protein
MPGTIDALTSIDARWRAKFCTTKGMAMKKYNILIASFTLASLIGTSGCFTYKKQETTTTPPVVETTPPTVVETTPSTTSSRTTTTTETPSGTSERSTTTTNY